MQCSLYYTATLSPKIWWPYTAGYFSTSWCESQYKLHAVQCHCLSYMSSITCRNSGGTTLSCSPHCSTSSTVITVVTLLVCLKQILNPLYVQGPVLLKHLPWQSSHVLPCQMFWWHMWSKYKLILVLSIACHSLIPKLHITVLWYIWKHIAFHLKWELYQTCAP